MSASRVGSGRPHRPTSPLAILIVSIPVAGMLLVALIGALLSRTNSDVGPSSPAGMDGPPTPPWTGPVHADGRDVLLPITQLTRFMPAQEAVALLGRPTRTAETPRATMWTYVTDDGEIRVFVHGDTVTYWEGIVARRRYKTPETRTIAELRDRVHLGMTRDAVFHAVGSPDDRMLNPVHGAGINMPPTDMVDTLIYRCRDGHLALQVHSAGTVAQI